MSVSSEKFCQSRTKKSSCWNGASFLFCLRSSSFFFSAASRKDVVSAPVMLDERASEKDKEEGSIGAFERMPRIDRRTDMRLLSSLWNTIRLYLAMMLDHRIHSEKRARCCR